MRFAGNKLAEVKFDLMSAVVDDLIASSHDRDCRKMKNRANCAMLKFKKKKKVFRLLSIVHLSKMYRYGSGLRFNAGKFSTHSDNFKERETRPIENEKQSIDAIQLISKSTSFIFRC